MRNLVGVVIVARDAAVACSVQGADDIPLNGSHLLKITASKLGICFVVLACFGDALGVSRSWRSLRLCQIFCSR